MRKSGQMYTLTEKIKKAVTEEGIASLPDKAIRYLKRAGKEREFQQQKSRVYRDILFISGCNENLPHPHRYRVLHQMEQLQAGGYTCDSVYFEEISISMVRCYSAFIIFRCPLTDKLSGFVQKAKLLHKPVWYDVDDLVIDTVYTDQIPWLSSMNELERNAYDENVRRMGKMLSLCDAAITTTKALAEELKKYVPEVLINRNCASDEMLGLSEKALAEKKRTSSRIVLGYFSGSSTHLDDFELILPVLSCIMKKYETVNMLIMGIMDMPSELEEFGDRIHRVEFMDYRKLPEWIASVDINLAPLNDTIFNRAKSENKWTEAALVQVVTVASRLGAFQEKIRDGIDGILCGSQQEWFERLCDLVEHPVKRAEIADNAYQRCRRECVTLMNSTNLCEWVKEHMTRCCGFILPALSISGGIRVALTHAEMLYEEGAQISLFLLDGEDEWYKDKACVFPVLSADQEKMQGQLDLAVATMWNTVDFLDHSAKIRKKIYLVQNYEVEFYPPGSPYRIPAAATYGKNDRIFYLTISKWCVKWLKDQYHVDAEYIPNGIFPDQYHAHRRKMSGKIRILIEGDCNAKHKNVDESFAVVERLDPEEFEIWYMSYNGTPKDWYRVDRFLHQIPYEQTPDVYAECDILLKTSLLESFSYPPLEMMASGGFVVAVLNDGNQEYLEGEKNCLLYARGDIEQAINNIFRLKNDAKLRDTLYQGGLETVKKRSWDIIRPKVLEKYLGK
ncbi:MAG: glycosyltransferase [Blautia sp.]|nr:glycosyltransferase [Clostridia bacterium]MDY4692256.1 glycosyltransferase [Blautia sp.]MDY5554589.1 glycosyltransferase [Blautia sp.]